MKLRLCRNRAVLLLAAAHQSGSPDAQRLAARAMHGETEASPIEVCAAITSLEAWAKMESKSSSIEARLRGHRADELAEQLLALSRQQEEVS